MRMNYTILQYVHQRTIHLIYFLLFFTFFLDEFFGADLLYCYFRKLSLSCKLAVSFEEQAKHYTMFCISFENNESKTKFDGQMLINE